MPFKAITSLTNPQIKNVVALRDRKAREAGGLTIVEGVREINAALAAKVPVKEFYVCRDFFSGRGEEALLKQFSSGTNTFEVPKAVFEKISYGDRQEGVLAVCAPKNYQLKDLKLKNDPLVVVLESVEKPGNLGAVLRSCDGAGVDALFLCGQVTDVYNPNVIRASIGTVFHIPVVVAENKEILEFLKKLKIRSVAAVVQAKNLYSQSDLKGGVAVVLGSEQDGLSDFWTKNSHVQVKVPMMGKADSLNVSTTAALLVYEVLRQRGLK